MNKEEILSAIHELACSQGYYGRLLSAIEEDPSILSRLEEQHFGDMLDLILFLET